MFESALDPITVSGPQTDMNISKPITCEDAEYLQRNQLEKFGEAPELLGYNSASVSRRRHRPLSSIKLNPITHPASTCSIAINMQSPLKYHNTIHPGQELTLGTENKDIYRGHL